MNKFVPTIPSKYIHLSLIVDAAANVINQIAYIHHQVYHYLRSFRVYVHTVHNKYNVQ